MPLTVTAIAARVNAGEISRVTVEAWLRDSGYAPDFENSPECWWTRSGQRAVVLRHGDILPLSMSFSDVAEPK